MMRMIVCLIIIFVSLNVYAGGGFNLAGVVAKPDAATIVVVHDDGKGPKTSDDVYYYVNTRYVTKSEERSVAVFTVKPGKWYLSGLYDEDEDISCTVHKEFLGGKIYYVYCNVYSKFSPFASFGTKGAVEITLITPQEAQKKISGREDPLEYKKNLDDEDDIDEDDFEDVLDEYEDYAKENPDKITAVRSYPGY